MGREGGGNTTPDGCTGGHFIDAIECGLRCDIHESQIDALQRLERLVPAALGSLPDRIPHLLMRFASESPICGSHAALSTATRHRHRLQGQLRERARLSLLCLRSYTRAASQQGCDGTFHPLYGAPPTTQLLAALLAFLGSPALDATPPLYAWSACMVLQSYARDMFPEEAACRAEAGEAILSAIHTAGSCAALRGCANLSQFVASAVGAAALDFLEDATSDAAAEAMELIAACSAAAPERFAAELQEEVLPAEAPPPSRKRRREANQAECGGGGVRSCRVLQEVVSRALRVVSDAAGGVGAEQGGLLPFLRLALAGSDLAAAVCTVPPIWEALCAEGLAGQLLPLLEYLASTRPDGATSRLRAQLATRLLGLLGRLVSGVSPQRVCGVDPNALLLAVVRFASRDEGGSICPAEATGIIIALSAPELGGGDDPVLRVGDPIPGGGAA